VGPGKGTPLTTLLFGRGVAAKSGPRISIGATGAGSGSGFGSGLGSSGGSGSVGPGKGIPLTTRLFGRPVAAKSGPRIPIGDAVTQTLGSEDARRAEESRLYSTMLRSAESHLGMLVSMIGFVPIDRRAEFQAAVVGGFQHRAGVLWPEPGNE